MLLLCLCITGLHAEDATDESDAVQGSSVSIEQLQATLKEVEGTKDLPAETRDQALEYYRAALSKLQGAQSCAENTNAFKKTIETGQAAIADIRRQMGSKKDSPRLQELTSNANLQISDLQQCLTEAQVDLTTQRQRRQELDDAQRALLLRYSSLRADLASEKKNLDAATGTRTAQAGDETPLLKKARTVLQTASRRYTTARIAMLEQELLSLPSRRRLLSAQRDLAVVQLSAAENRVTRIKQLFRQRVLRTAEEEQRGAEQAERDCEGQNSLLRDYARETTTYCRQLTDIAHRFEGVDQQFATASASTRKIYELQQSAQQLLEIGGHGPEFGQSLRELRDKLPLDTALSQQYAAIARAILDIRIQRIHLQDQFAKLGELTDANSAAESLLHGEAQAAPETVRTLAEALTARRKQVLQRLLDTQGQYVGRMAELREGLNELMTGTDNLSTLFNEKLMWLPSAPPVGLPWLEQVVAGVHWLVTADAWSSAAHALAAGLSAHPLLGGAALLGALVLIFGRARLLRKLAQTRESSKGHSDAFNRVFVALTISVVLAAAIPAVLYAGGKLMLLGAVDEPFAAAMGAGFCSAGVIGLALYGLQILCVPDGVFAAHFAWREESRRILASNVWLLSLILVPAAFLISATEASGKDDYFSGLGRLAFIAASGAFALFLYRVLHPRRGAGLKLRAAQPFRRTRRFWYPLACAIPAVLGAFAAYGYFEPALRVQLRLFLSAGVILAGEIVYGLATRWVVVAHERLALRRAREESARAQAAQEAKRVAQVSGEATPQTLRFGHADLPSVSDQTRTLLSVMVAAGVLMALWMIWSDIVPALAALDQIPLWPRMAVAGLSQPGSVTLLGLLKMLLWALLTIVAARNIAGMLEIVALQRFALDSGTSYAIITVSRYAIIAIGAIAVFHALGVEWSGLQWILASLSVGLGFGLQEIVANFVAGLIILFERRIRVGDTITVQDLTGTVSRIHIRATTVVDWDNREILVPNKSFITDNVVNWTLSDPVTRLVLKVGIAYGSDTVRAQKIMLDAARANPLVMESPAPTAFFIGFGDSALNFEIRIFVRELSKRMPVTHELHVAVEKALRENGIEIPFPQLDLHVRKMPDEPKQQ